MAERFIGTNEFGELLFYDDQFGTTRTQPPVDAQGQTIGRGGIFGDIQRAPRDKPVIPLLSGIDKTLNQMGLPDPYPQASVGFNQVLSNIFGDYPTSNILGPNAIGRGGQFGTGLNATQFVDPAGDNYYKPPSLFNIDFGGAGGNFGPFRGFSGPGRFTDFDVSTGYDEFYNDMVQRGANIMSRSGDATADALNDTINFKLRREIDPKTGNLVTGETVLYRDTEVFDGGPNAYLTNSEMLAAANSNGFDNINDYLKTLDKRFVPIDVTSPNPVGTGKREEIEKQEIVLSDGTTRFETDAEAIVRLNRENEQKIKKENERVKLAERRQGIGLTNKLLNIFGTPSGVETYMVDGEEITYTPGDEATDAADIALLKEKGIIQDEEEVDSTPLMTAEQGKELLKLYIMGAGLLNQQEANTGMRIAPMFSQKGLTLPVEQLYKKRRI